MRITNYLNTTKEEVDRKEFNICLGISLGNKYFTPEHIRAYLLWAVENTKNTVAVIIPDKIQAINYEVRSSYSPTRAMTVAMRKGKELEAVIRKIIEDLNIPESKVHILHWSDLEDTQYLETLKLIQEAFESDPKFRESIIRMVRETPHIQTLNLSHSDLAKLAQYIVAELPILIQGITFEGESYTLIPYPGFAELDYFALDLQTGKTFPELTAKLKVQNTLHLIEAYAD